MGKPIGFKSEDDFRRTARVVLAHERTPRNPTPPARPGPRSVDHGGRQRLGRTAADHLKNSFGSIEVLDGPKGAETPTGEVIEAWNGFADLLEGARVHFNMIANDWELTAGDCSATTTTTSTSTTTTGTSSTTATSSTSTSTTTATSSTSSSSTSSSTSTSSTSSSSTSSSTTETTSSTTVTSSTTTVTSTTATSTTEACSGLCYYHWTCGTKLWVFDSNSCSNCGGGTVCCPPTWCGNYEGEIYSTMCMPGQICGGPPTGCPSC